MVKKYEYSEPVCELLLIEIESGVLSDSGIIEEPSIGGPGEIEIE